jgi:hypothetical protein
VLINGIKVAKARGGLSLGYNPPPRQRIEMRTRTHYPPAIERRIVYGALWLFVACVIVILLTSCSPFTSVNFSEVTATPTMTATATAVNHGLQTPAPYWQLAAQGWEHITAAVISGGKIGH